MLCYQLRRCSRIAGDYVKILSELSPILARSDSIFSHNDDLVYAYHKIKTNN